jgi:serine/threonine protein kinase
MLPLDLDVCQKASRYATRVCQEMTKRSSLIKDLKPDCVPSFERDEIMPFLGDKLGKGGFNSVYELEKIELDESAPISSEEHRRQRAQVARGLSRKLAVKFLNESAMGNSNEFCNGAADLLLEAKYLSALSNHPHPSIISLHGVAAAGAAGFATGQMGGYFLVVDRLYDTLDKRIDVWKELKRRKLRHTSQMNVKLLQAMFLQRLQVATDICSAIRHLHQLKVVFRDLKPDNVGFDFDGRVKLFDFGLAKELDPLQKTADGTMYEMSGGTGSRRFMAPEVALGEPYNLSADIYSFAILFWELVALEKAFGKLSQEEHRKNVIEKNDRPPLKKEWKPAVQYILQSCWKRNPKDRVNSNELYKMLKEQVDLYYEDGFEPCEEGREKRLCI